MPVSYTIDKQRRLVLTLASGRVTFAEAKAHQDRLKSDSEFDPGFNQLVDGCEVTGVDMDAYAMRTLMKVSFFSSSSRRALLACSPLVFGIGRMLEAYREAAGGQEQIRVFSDRNTALQWLGLYNHTD